MKTVFNTENYKVMKNYIKFICAILMLLGTSAHAWGTTCTLYGGLNGATTIGTITNGQTIPACSTEGATWDIAANWASKTYWTTTKYSASSPTTTKPSGSYLYMSGDELPDGITALYAVYVLDDTYYSGAPGYQLDLSPTSGATGYAEATKYMAIQPGTSITITAHPADGKVVTEWIVLDGELDDITPTSTTSTTFVFTMPSSDVAAEVRFGDPCTSRSVTFATNITKDFGTAPGKYQDYTLSAGSGTVTWSSDNDAIASVNSSGVVTLNKAGSTYINVEVAEDGTYCAVSDRYKITVNEMTPTLSSTASGKELTVSGITAHGATFSGGVVTFKGNATINSYGYIVGTSSDVTYATRVTQAGTNDDVDLNTAFGSKSVTGLTAGTTYYVRPIANNKTQIGYGTAVSFTTLNEYDIDLDKNNSDVGSMDGLATEIEAPTRTGYTIEGYYTTDGLATKVATAAGALQSGITVSATNWTNGSSQWVKAGGATFYTKWTANNYTVTFDQNGGSGGSSNVTATFGSAMPAATMPTTPPTGKEFAGYYYNSVQYYDADGNSAHVWDVADDVTLTASWTTATPTLTIANVDKVVIRSTAPSLAEGASTSVSYNSTVTLSHGDPESGYYWLDWNVYETGSEGNTVTVTDNSFSMPAYDVTVSANLYTGLVFSCSELTLTPHLVTPSTPIFITSVANKKVRSQDYITITGSGLTPNTPLTFPGLNSKFEVLTATGGTISTDANGEIDDVNAYIFYTPAADATTDGLDQMSGITVSVGGAKPKTASLVQNIIGRHLPTTGYVIAGKKDGKWWAMPSNMASTTNPKPSEIAVDDFNNPSVAYTATSNIYGLEGPTTSGSGNNISTGNGQCIRLTMSIDDGTLDPHAAPLFGSATGTTTIGKSGNSQASSHLSEGWWWALTQINTSISNPQDAKYTIKCANNTSTLSLRDNAGDPDWGLFASGVEQLRLIPASDIPFAEAYFIEWGQHGGVIEVDAQGVDATSVIAHLGEATSSAITLSQTGTSGGKSSKYNYTVNFGDGIDFAASTSNGAMLTLEWKNGEMVKAISNIVVPKIIASSDTMKSIMSGDAQWETEVHVLPDVTLTANAGDFESNDVMIKQLEIYPGATVVVTKGAAGSGTLKVKTLVLRNGWTCASGTRKYDVARLYITPSTASLAKNAVVDVWYMDWYIDYDQYYPIAVPWKVAVNSSNIVHRYTSNTATFGPSGSIRLRYYDGEQRATSGQSMIGQNWKDYGKSGNEYLPGYLEPSKGYSFSAKRPSGKAFSIVRMTLGIPSNDWTALGEQGEVSGTHKDQVSVTGWGKGTADWYAMGWNFIGNPYMCTFNGDDDGISGKLELQNGGSIKYATIPSIDFSNYDQVAIADADLKPARGFFIQANNAEAQNITFNASKIVDPTPAPARYMTQTEAIPEQEAYVRLSYEGGKDQMGLIIGEDYTEAYEVNADLAKVLGDAGFVKTYMQYGGMDMAYVAINEMLAKEWIPVTVILPTAGEYTYSLMSSSEVEHLEGVYLIDYANENKVTNLINENYVFTAQAGTISNRFAINAIVGERETPTDIDVVGADKNGDAPIKFIYRDKVYIWHHGNIYDATGKKVREINK